MSIMVMKNLIFLFFLLVACKQPFLDPKEEYFREDINLSIRHFPENPIKLNLIQSVILKYSRDLQLYSIENGFDSIQLRVWFLGSPFKDSSQHLLILKKFKGSSWQGLVVDFSYPVEGGRFNIDNPVSSLSSEKINVESQSLISAAFSKLPFRKSYQNEYDSCMVKHDNGASQIVIELADDTHYFLYGFRAPSRLDSNCRILKAPELEAFLISLSKLFNDRFIKEFLAPYDSSFIY